MLAEVNTQILQGSLDLTGEGAGHKGFEVALHIMGKHKSYR